MRANTNCDDLLAFHQTKNQAIQQEEIMAASTSKHQPVLDHRFSIFKSKEPIDKKRAHTEDEESADQKACCVKNK
jgi:hypothetical protein